MISGIRIYPVRIITIQFIGIFVQGRFHIIKYGKIDAEVILGIRQDYLVGKINCFLQYPIPFIRLHIAHGCIEYLYIRYDYR